MRMTSQFRGWYEELVEVGVHAGGIKGGCDMEAKELMQELAGKIERAANVKAAFGEPVGQDGVIPVARVSVRGGGGGGTGDMPEGEGRPRGKGQGIGLGLNIATTPVGYIKRTPSGAEFVPVVDKNRMILAGAVVAGIGLMALRTGLRVFGGK